MDTQLKRWMKFHKHNPDIYPELIKLAEMVYGKRKFYSVYILFGVIRYNRDKKTIGGKFKINNNLIPFYSLLLITEHPKFKNFFKNRSGTHIDHINGQDLLYYHNKLKNKGGA